MGAGSVGAALEVITLSDSDDEVEADGPVDLSQPCRRPDTAQASPTSFAAACITS